MQNISLTTSSLVVMALVFLFQHVGLDIAEAEVAQTVSTIVSIAAAAAAYYGRVRKGDIDIFGRRKNQGVAGS